jgi:hypothetical protein
MEFAYRGAEKPIRRAAMSLLAAVEVRPLICRAGARTQLSFVFFPKTLTATDYLF